MLVSTSTLVRGRLRVMSFRHAPGLPRGFLVLDWKTFLDGLLLSARVLNLSEFCPYTFLFHFTRLLTTDGLHGLLRTVVDFCFRTAFKTDVWNPHLCGNALVLEDFYFTRRMFFHRDVSMTSVLHLLRDSRALLLHLRLRAGIRLYHFLRRGANFVNHLRVRVALRLCLHAFTRFSLFLDHVSHACLPLHLRDIDADFQRDMSFLCRKRNDNRRRRFRRSQSTAGVLKRKTETAEPNPRTDIRMPTYDSTGQEKSTSDGASSQNTGIRRRYSSSYHHLKHLRKFANVRSTRASDLQI